MPTRRSFLLLAATAPTAAGRVAAAQTRPLLRISGTGSGTGAMQLLAAAYLRAHPGAADVQVMPAIGSAGGIAAVQAGKLDIALSNRPPNAAELARSALAATEYARTPFVLALHENLGVRALTLDQVASLFALGATLPGGQRVRPVMRSNDATDTALVKSMSPAVARALDDAMARRGMLDADTDSAAADLIQNTPGALGASTLALIAAERRPLVALALDGVEPTPANLASGRYPWHKRMLAITADPPSDAVRRFVDFLRGAEAAKLLRELGHLTP